jgi:hypothetical protein
MEQGIDARHWSEVGDLRAPDAEIMQWARQHGCVVFTNDLDYSALLAATRASGPSVLQVRTQDVLEHRTAKRMNLGRGSPGRRSRGSLSRRAGPNRGVGGGSLSRRAGPNRGVGGGMPGLSRSPGRAPWRVFRLSHGMTIFINGATQPGK